MTRPPFSRIKGRGRPGVCLRLLLLMLQDTLVLLTFVVIDFLMPLNSEALRQATPGNSRQYACLHSRNCCGPN